MLLSFIMSAFGCNQNSQKNTGVSKDEKYAIQLVNVGFLQYADTDSIDGLNNDLKKSFNIYAEEINRLVHIDAEELSEFSFDFFLPELNKILAKRNLHISAKKINDKDDSFDVLLNNDTMQLYTAHELGNNTFWDTAPRNFFRKVNEILEKRNIDERFYLLYGGNDLQVMLLTEKQHSIIADYYKNNKKEIPYKP